jgi:Putative ATPase subunit of terminase (gpP-like)
MHQCPYCHSAERQVKSGFNRTGSQRLQCQPCHRQYTPEPLPLGYDDKTREQALKLYLEGNGFRRIGRLLSVNHQSVANWVTAAHAQLPAGGAPAAAAETADTLEMDELFTFVGSKKSPRISSPSSSARRGASSRTRSASSARRK